MNWDQVNAAFWSKFFPNFRLQLVVLFTNLREADRKFRNDVFGWILPWLNSSWPPPPFPVALVQYLDSVGNAFQNFNQNIVLEPLKIAVQVGLLEAFPVPKHYSQRVVKLDDAYRMCADSIFNGFIDAIQAFPQIPSSTARVGQQFRHEFNTAWTISEYETIGVAGIIAELLKAAGKTRLKAMIAPAFVIIGLVLVFWMLNDLARQIAAPKNEKALELPALTNKNPFVIRKQRHRVRDNPKLVNR